MTTESKWTKRNPENRYLSTIFRTLTLVRETGLEPVRYEHTPLKRARLPIPPLSLGTSVIVAESAYVVKGFLKKIRRFKRRV